MGEFKIAFGFVMVENEDWLIVETFADGGVVKEFREEDGTGGIDDNIAVGREVEVDFDARPIFEIAQVFRNVNWAIEGSLVMVAEDFVESEGGAE